MRLRSWVMWVVAPVFVGLFGVVILFWHPVPAQKDFGNELFVNGHRIALPISAFGTGLILDGGTIGFGIKDADGVKHVFMCRWPDFRTMTHFQERPPEGNEGYGIPIPEDADVRNLLYHSAVRLQARKDWDDWQRLWLLYPSVYERNFVIGR